MTYTGRRTQLLPRHWQVKRRRILRRDLGICYICGKAGADEVDHVLPASRGGTDDDANLRAIHSHPCHATKTAKEARGESRRRPAEPHPGLVA